MTNENADSLDLVFTALADKTRRALVNKLAKSEELTITELTQGFSMSLAAVSKHIKVLERAKLIRRRIDGRIHYISLAPERLGIALDWISIYRNFWQSRINELNKIL